MSVPEDALHAARASMGSAASPMDAVAASLGLLSSALREDVDAVGFALGLMAGTFVSQGLDIIECTRLAPTQFAEFVVRARAMQGRTVCATRHFGFPSVTCGLDPGHRGQHAAGRLRW